MCTAYSTLGQMEKSEHENGILLVAYFMYHMKMKTAIILHENVKGFEANKLEEIAYGFGYDHVQFQCKPADVGFCVGRPRKFLVSILHWGRWDGRLNL